MTSSPLVLSDRDHAIIRAVWSLGATTSDVLRPLVTPASGPRALRRRLQQLCAHRYLRQRRVVGGRGHLYLYTVGHAAVRADDGLRDGWQPSLAQLEHTLAVGDVLAALVTTDAPAPLTVTSWQGEAELRSWARHSDPYPDARITWTQDGRPGAWQLEVDRGTEPRRVWRRKLVRYAVADSTDTILVVTTSPRRAANIARLAGIEGLPLIATTFAHIHAVGTTWCIDSHARRGPLGKLATD